MPKSQENENLPILNDIYITADDMKRELVRLISIKAVGHPKLLKSLSGDDIFVEVVTELFIKCTTSGILPLIWKEASVVALFKIERRQIL